MDFSSDANANFEGLLVVNREICMPQMAEKTSADAPPSCAVVPLHNPVFLPTSLLERTYFVGSFSSKYLKDIWNLPNILTMLRLVLIPVFAGLFLAGYEKWALAVFIIASITDYLDGYLARKNNQITAFGKLMDPLADKLMVCTALLGQGLSGVFPWPAILIVMTKEVVMIIGGIYMLQNGIVVYSNILGKAAQFSFIAALILSFWHKEFVAASLPLDRIILWIAVALALVALVDYALDAVKKLKAHKAGKVS